MASRLTPGSVRDSYALGTACPYFRGDAHVPTKAMLRAGTWIDEGYLPADPDWRPPADWMYLLLNADHEPATSGSSLVP